MLAPQIPNASNVYRIQCFHHIPPVPPSLASHFSLSHSCIFLLPPRILYTSFHTLSFAHSSSFYRFSGLEREQPTPPLSKRIHNQRAQEQSNTDPDRHLDHAVPDVEHDAVEACCCCCGCVA